MFAFAGNGATSREILTYCSSVPPEMCRQVLAQQQHSDVGQLSFDCLAINILPAGTRLASNLSKVVLPHMKQLFTKISKKEKPKQSPPAVPSIFDRLFSVQQDESTQSASGAYIGLPFLPDLYLGAHDQ